MQSNLTYLNYIDGTWRDGTATGQDENRNPANPSQVLGKSTRSSKEDVQKAIAAAKTAQKTWVRLPRPIRGQYLEKAAAIIKTRIDLFAKTMTEEEGKNFNEARGEVLKTINVLEFTASEARRPTGEVIPSEMPNTFLYTTRVPYGVVGIITPWNFPLCIPAWKIAPALLEGNTVIFKPATITPGCAVLLVKAFEEAGLPKGVLNLVFGSGSVVGNAIVEHPDIHCISFTGSNEVGTRIHEQAAKRLCKTQLEMGGKNPLIVCSDADLELAAEATVMGAFGSTGQRCTATSRVIVERKVHAEFTKTLVEKTRTITVGDGMKNPKAMGPVVDEHQYGSVLSFIEEGKRQGLKLLCGGEKVVTPENGFFIAPTIFDNVPAKSKLAQEEIFGPVLSVIIVDTYEQALDVANDVAFGLTSSVYTQDIQRIMQYADQIETGMLHVNSPTVGGEAQAPFGGMKATGMGGREMGSTGPEIFCEIKTIYIDYNKTVRQGNLY